MWLARGSSLLRSRDQGRSWEENARLPLGIAGHLAAATRVGRRLLRAGIHHFLPGRSDVLIANQHIFRREAGSDAFHCTARLHGSRPLAVATDGELICYGEYRGNAERSAVHVWGSLDLGRTWAPVWRFAEVRHVHGVFFDPFTRTFWVTTGDEDSEAGIWVTRDRFRTLDEVMRGNQQVRAVHLCFTAQYVYFGSDTPLARNHIYRLERCSGTIERLVEVGSSVFFGCTVGNHLFFSTAAEPSDINRSDRAELWHSADGNRWRLFRAVPKDRWPLRLFQYGQVRLPGGPGDEHHLLFTPFAAGGDQRTWIVPVASIGLP